MEGKEKPKTNLRDCLLLALVFASALLNCDPSRPNQDRPRGTADKPSTAIPRSPSKAPNILQRQVDAAAAQGALRVATLREASVKIIVDPQPGLLPACPCLSIMAARILINAGYSAVTGSNADMADRSTLNLMASSSYLEGKTTLTLYGTTSHHLGVAPEIYEAALIRGARNPTVAEVEELVARVIMSEPFQDYTRTVDPGEMPETSNRHITQADVDATCNRSHKQTKPTTKQARNTSSK